MNGNHDALVGRQHFCKGWPGCCRDRLHTIKQLEDEYVDDIERPEPWVQSRCLGLEDAVDFAGEFMSTHGVLFAVLLMTQRRGL